MRTIALIALAVLVGLGSFAHPAQEARWVDLQLPTLSEGN